MTLAYYSSKLITPTTSWKANLYCDLYRGPSFSFFFFSLYPYFHNSMQSTTETLFSLPFLQVVFSLFRKQSYAPAY